MYINTLISSIFLVYLFYNYIKGFSFRYAGDFAIYLGFTKLHSYEVAKGFVELVLIVMMHIIFCLLLFYFFHYSSAIYGLDVLPNVKLIIDGALLGIGIMGASSLFSRMYIEFMKYAFSTSLKIDTRNWLTMARGGWIRHHYHTIQVLPIPLALLITLGQVICEEFVFRGIFINLFLPWGMITAILTSTALFMLMQIFYMPNRIASAFPVIGAFVVGIIHGYLFIVIRNLYPLILAHIVFFAIAVL